MGKLSEILRGSASIALSSAKSPQATFDRCWDASRRYVFSVVFLAIVLAKLFHIWVCMYSVPALSLIFWSPTYFWVDVLLILGACFLTQWYQGRIYRDLAALITVPLGAYFSALTAANISYYVHMDGEIYWDKTLKFHEEVPSPRKVISAIVVAFLVDGAILVAAYFATPYLFRLTDAFLDVWGSLLPAKLRCCHHQRERPGDVETYEQIAIDDFDDESRDTEPMPMLDAPSDLPKQKTWSPITRIIVVSFSCITLLLCFLRPSDPAYSYLSESLPLALFGGPTYRPAYESAFLLPGDFKWLNGKTALDDFPMQYDWLPSGDAPGAFPDWSPFKINHQKSAHDHYNPKNDPLHTPNLDGDLLGSIKQAIQGGDVNIKHIILFKLESTRFDVWPLRADSYPMRLINESWGGQVPPEIEQKLANLTPNAERMTGLSTGFNKPRAKHIGGIGVTNAHTAGTYTLKSITGTMCGVNPIAADGNKEYLNNIYQPCLPHIFEALNHQPNISSHSDGRHPDDWKSWPWHSAWMQSNFGTYDKQDELTPILGFKDITTWESIKANGDKYVPEETQEERDHGHADKVMRNYIRDLLADVKKNNTRLFLGYLTHNTHTPWFKPGEYEQFFGSSHGVNDQVNRYLNAIAFEDEWMGEVLQLLDEAGIADETLIVMTGDHALSLPNDGGITAYHDAHIGGVHVPLYLAHPKLPSIQIDNDVLSVQILPTILDLLIETSSANDESIKVLKDLLPLYQGQSLIRPLINEHEGKSEWQFSTMNPGGTWLSLRAAGKPYRLIVPLKVGATWRFTNTHADKFEWHPIQELDVRSLSKAVKKAHGEEAEKWLTEAVHVTQWWILDNWRRWGYKP